MSLNESVVAQVSNQNFSVVAGQPAQLANQQLINSTNYQQAIQAIMAASVAKAQELLLTTDVSEAAGLTPVAQIAGKVAGTTPPVTV